MYAVSLVTTQQIADLITSITSVIASNMVIVIAILGFVLGVKFVAGMFTSAATTGTLQVPDYSSKFEKLAQSSRETIARSDRVGRENRRIMKGLKY